MTRVRVPLTCSRTWVPLTCFLVLWLVAAADLDTVMVIDLLVRLPFLGGVYQSTYMAGVQRMSEKHLIRHSKIVYIPPNNFIIVISMKLFSTKNHFGIELCPVK